MTTSVHDAITVIHGPAGCAHHNFSLFHASGLDNDIFHIPAMLSSGMQEQDVIFGGEEALKSAIARAEAMRPSCIFVLSSCIPDTIGDDTCAVCSSRTAVPTYFVPTGGFLGGGFFAGYQNALLSISAPATRGTLRPEVSIIGEKNLEYEVEQNYREVVRLLALLDLQVGLRFVRNIRFADISRLGTGSLNILREPSLEPVGRTFQNRFGTPFVCSFPTGFSGTLRFLEQVGDVMDVDSHDAIRKEELMQKEVIVSFRDLQGMTVSLGEPVTVPNRDANLEDLFDALDMTLGEQAPQVPVPIPFPVGTTGISRLLHRWRRTLHA
ncbi:MAG: nitrogenase component 1 [Methanoregulaceae archaeon]|nr:nitrogenase component 1 [Methanoregulaceae archaeon]